jgi:hypothetical protein
MKALLLLTAQLVQTYWPRRFLNRRRMLLDLSPGVSLLEEST